MWIASSVAAFICILTWTISTLLAGRMSRPPVAQQAKPVVAAEVSAPPPDSPSSGSSVPAPRPAPELAPSSSVVVAPVTAPDINALLVRASPSFSKISVDGVPVTGNPFRGRYSRNGVHAVEAEAKGYQPLKKRFELNGDLVVDLILARQPSGEEGTRPGGGGRRSRATVSSAPARMTTPTEPAAAAAPRRQEVDPAGGREPLRPIEVRNPYGPQ
jgi:hypothetical protein